MMSIADYETQPFLLWTFIKTPGTRPLFRIYLHIVYVPHQPVVHSLMYSSSQQLLFLV